MSHRISLAVWAMLYGSDVEEAEIIMPNTCSLDRSILEVGWSLGILFDRPVALNNMLKVLLHFDVSLLWLSKVGRHPQLNHLTAAGPPKSTHPRSHATS